MFKETSQTRKELISKGGGWVLFKETSQTRKELISKGGGGGGGVGLLFQETSQTRKELISKVEGEGSLHWFQFHFKVYRVPRRGCELFSDSFYGDDYQIVLSLN